MYDYLFFHLSLTKSVSEDGVLWSCYFFCMACYVILLETDSGGVPGDDGDDRAVPGAFGAGGAVPGAGRGDGSVAVPGAVQGGTGDTDVALGGKLIILQQFQLSVLVIFVCNVV